jgi:deoxycytidylate deaminase
MSKHLIDAFSLAANACEDSRPGISRYRHGSVILDSKNRVIAVGRNYWAGTEVITKDSRIKKTVHSEINALTKVNIRRLRGSTVVNFARTNQNVVLSRPCPSCWAVLKKLGIQKVFYTEFSDLTRPLWREERF